MRFILARLIPKSPLRTVLMALQLLLAGLSGHGAYADEKAFSVLRSPRPLPEFSLVDQHGGRFTRSQLRDRWSLIFVGFTSCPHVCPMTMMKLEAVRGEMGLRIATEKLPHIIFLAVDPARDQAALKDYLSHFDLNNIGITGEKTQIDTLVKGLDAAYRFTDKRPGSNYYDVLHTSAIHLISPQGEVVALMNPPFAVQPMAQFIVSLIRRYASGGNETNKDSVTVVVNEG